MEIQDHDIQHITQLARLSFGEDVEQIKKQLTSILDYVDVLQEVNTKDVPVFMHAVGQENHWREDEVEACSEDTRTHLVDAFPLKQGDLLEVQAVFENRESA
ncbi:MAG: Aspartyl/glutamyl-tRNA(Asn/Gln) amidotransferase subunit C [Candidatus Uhrbacteria bacterium GW2011_GWE2_40_58]|nr:MAG: Aspartyl/glutamyl-tRNA(Asn/Gln) amidotransferase subunit C [Candidatus Uhrbacteria bacterium GW2011_GWF2_40_263]KKR67963.1 MAG: Aspartyl/glutamyl-tRNA(Asn/Gln) amidotransferase subunit C [Candidatus Uhrbacteria bacterium GW2011_GWE2_40_58]OGL92409.1 MAG: hypothetical protein A2239_02175 [Candidatus Uhrbacteria bacterium RIFOXYA2_FULL_40_9]OGL97000.1 MAG: hypothetical protein A2332_03980 [Candidatus Uhrbacteria bacterium RIFOXYB2_FULL_41_18]HBK34762.1 Asp-tRNA(Asn)/Glu-tRNA(Gln) amidotra